MGSAPTGPREQMVAFVSLFALSVVTNNRSFSPGDGDPAAWARYLAPFAFGAFLFASGGRSALLVMGVAGPLMLVLDRHLSNHESLYASLWIGFLAVYAARAIAERRLRVEIGALHRELATLLRAAFLVFYFWVFFHKLNPHFLDPASSCGVHLLETTRRILPILPLPPALDSWVAPGTLLAEASIPFLLLFSRTRKAGVLLAFAFHAALGIGFPSFQFLVYGFLFLFTPEEELECGVARARRVATRLGRDLPARVATIARVVEPRWVRAALGVVTALALEVFHESTGSPDLRRILGQNTYHAALFGLLVVIAIAYASAVGWPSRSRPLLPAWRPGRARPAWPLWLLPAFVLAQGAQPHLGIKAVQSFAMFSNLDTGNGQSNHYLLPAWLQISDNLNDPIHFLEGNDPRLRGFANPPRQGRDVMRAARPPVLAQPWIALRREVTRRAEAGEEGLHLVFSRQGVQHRVPNAERDPALAAGFLERNYLLTRPIALKHHGACRW